MSTSTRPGALDPIANLLDSEGASSELLKATLNAVPDPLLVFEAGGRLIFANSAASLFLRVRNVVLETEPRRLCASIGFSDSVTQAPIPPHRRPLALALAGETIDQREYLVRHVRQAMSLWIECSARPIADAGGQIRGAALTFRDITERRKREQSENVVAQLRDFVYHENLAGILHTTVDGRILDCNDAVVRMFGYSTREELKGIRAQQLYYDAGERDRLLRLVNSSPQVRDFEVCFRCRDNSKKWALISVRLFDPPPGEVGGSLVSTIIDITERKLSEEAVRQSQQRFEAFMRYLPGIAFIKDLNRKYIYFNEGAWTRFQKRPEDLIGKDDEDIWPWEDAARYRANDNAVIQSARPLEFVESMAHADGPHSWLIYKFPIIEDGRVMLLGGIGIDVTERRTLEDQLTQSRKMEALGRLAGGVAHDFNNLLTVISGYGQLALEGLGTTSNARMTTYLEEILNSARRASGLTSQLLAFSRRQAVQPKVLDLCVLLRNLERLLQRMIGEHVDLTVRCNEPCLVLADAHQMEQVLMNLAVNARDAMPLGGILEIDCSRLPKPIERPGLLSLGVLLEVADTGIGMDDAVKAQMFEPFFTSKDKGKGTGLGLSTVYGIISQAGGEIEVQSEPGQGSRFKVYFPLATGDVEEVSVPLSSATPVGQETVLLVEDEPSVRALAETVLKKLGYQVFVAESAQSALEIWQKNRDNIDILLTDVIMPRMSGGELAHKLRGLDPDLKILFMSGYTDDMLASHGVMAGETQIIPKPFTAEGLGRKLRDVLDS